MRDDGLGPLGLALVAMALALLFVGALAGVTILWLPFGPEWISCGGCP